MDRIDQIVGVVAQWLAHRISAEFGSEMFRRLQVRILSTSHFFFLDLFWCAQKKGESGGLVGKANHYSRKMASLTSGIGDFRVVPLLVRTTAILIITVGIRLFYIIKYMHCH
jgi:hypothetical protein